jgi:D-cysteine desulfhydrase
VSFALFDELPALQGRVPRVALGELPTPVEPLHAVSRELGSDGEAWVKRDDISSPTYGGNKVRTLEMLFGEARAQGRPTLLATGAFGSNHALAVALHAPRVGFIPEALLFPQTPSLAALQNLHALSWSGAALHALCHWSALPFGMRRFRRGPQAPYVMPPGGATPLGALGYVSAGLELGQQIESGQLPLPKRIIVGVGSTCTSAGLLVGLSLAAHLQRGFTAQTQPWLTSVRVSPWPVTSRFRVLGLAQRAARLLHDLSQGGVPLFSRAALGARFEIDGRYLGPGYGKPSAAGNEAEALWRRCGLPALDGTYSAKAASRVVAGLRAAEPGPVLFWSTKSSVPLPATDPAHAAQRTARVALPIRTWLEQAERALAAREGR